MTLSAYSRELLDRPLICRTEHLIICMHLNPLSLDDGGPQVTARIQHPRKTFNSKISFLNTLVSALQYFVSKFGLGFYKVIFLVFP